MGKFSFCLSETCSDALNREESCGGHFRAEHQFTNESPEVTSGVTQSGEALRNHNEFSYVTAWEYKGFGNLPEIHKEDRKSPQNSNHSHPSLTKI